jgi:beta-lactamase regulating signal transducer with metallopeptidase domain
MWFRYVPLALLTIWLAGVFALLTRLLMAWRSVARLAHPSLSQPVANGLLADLAMNAAQTMGLAPAGAPHLRVGLPDCPAPLVPMTWGWRRPVVLLPVGATTWTSERLRVVLLHETAHIARADWACQMFAHAVCALYWFHPLVWIAAARLRAESEAACDDRVLGAGVMPSDYAGHLLDVVRAVQQAQQPSLASTTTTAAAAMVCPTQFETRVRAILARRRDCCRAERQPNVTARLLFWWWQLVRWLAWQVCDPS